MADQPAIVLVHSPLVGPASWAPTATVLRARGYPVVVPSLVEALSAGPPYYRALAHRVADTFASSVGHGPVVLVAHSGAGALLPAVADAVAGAVRTAIFVDALLPHPGHSWFDTAPADVREQLLGLVSGGHLPPWHEWFAPELIAQLVPDPDQRQRLVAEIPRAPLAYFEELAPTARAWPPHQVAYLRLSEAYEEQAAEAAERDWVVMREPLDHLAVLTRPDLVGARIASVLEP